MTGRWSGRRAERRRRDFAAAYAAMELLAWSSEEFGARLLSAPRTTLADVGITVPDGVRILVDPSSGAAPVGEDSVELRRALGAWESGWPTAELHVSVPLDRHVPTVALSDDELAGVVGGHRVAGYYGGACCAAD